MSKHVLLLGASGTIGRATADALLADGHRVTCFLRCAPDMPLNGCETVVGDISAMGLEPGHYDAILSCLASRTGAPKDAWAVEHDLQSLVLSQAQVAGIGQFILLSAICVQKPRLAFQQAKLAFEAKLMTTDLNWSIVRPTAFFKSLSGQIERVRSGKPYLVFGDGTLTACKPISDADLGRFLSSCLTDPAKTRRVLPIGGPGPALTPLDQGKTLFEAFELTPKFRHVPIAVMRAIIGGLSLAGVVSNRAREKAELARIGHYYATESMLVWDESSQRYSAALTPEFGEDTLRDHFEKAKRGEITDNRGAHAVF
ncbi:MAG: NAD(P)H-binding protein [Pseudomonadota bacterium]